MGNRALCGSPGGLEVHLGLVRVAPVPLLRLAKLIEVVGRRELLPDDELPPRFVKSTASAPVRERDSDGDALLRRAHDDVSLRSF